MVDDDGEDILSGRRMGAQSVSCETAEVEVEGQRVTRKRDTFNGDSRVQRDWNRAWDIGMIRLQR